MNAQAGHQETHDINLHVPGILSLLSEYLYSTPQTALRELIQNAHDSCLRRQYEDPNLPSDYQPRLDISIDRPARRLILADNGCGLSGDEIHAYLSTVGRGYTGELRDRLEFGSREEALELIGQFGLGLLSAFLVARRLTVETLSFQPGVIAFRWESLGEATYTLQPVQRLAVGSTLTLDLRLDGEFLLNEGIVREAIRTYADFLRIAIHLNGSPTPINARSALWHSGADVDAYRDYLIERLDISAPLTVIPLHDQSEAINQPGSARDQVVTPLRGVLFIPAQSALSLGEHGRLSVYIRRMFVTDSEPELLPRWARFVGGIVDSPALTPAASREQVRHDEAFYAVQRALESQILIHLRGLAEDQPGVWRRIVRVHSDLIKGWALQVPEFFAAVADLVTFSTTAGTLTLPEIVERSPGGVLYYTDGGAAPQDRALYLMQDRLMVDASGFAETAFLEQYGALHPALTLHKLGSADDVPCQPVADPTPYHALLAYFSNQGVRAHMVTFEPAAIPALMHHPAGPVSEDSSEGGTFGDQQVALTFFLDEYARLHADKAERGGILYLNASSPLIKRLAEAGAVDERVAAVLEILLQGAQLFSGQMRSPNTIRQAFELFTFSIEQLL